MTYTQMLEDLSVQTGIITNQRVLLRVLEIDPLDTDKAEWEHCLSRAVYNNTECGAWARFVHQGIEVGSIVEGIDQETDVIRLTYTFMASDLWDALDEIERQANDLWEETHGCSQCGILNGEPDAELTAVNPTCPECNGKGVSI